MRNIIFGVLALCVAGAMFWGYQNDRAELRQVRIAGKSAVVEQITRYTETRRKGGTTYSAEINFQTEDGRKIGRNKSFPSEVLEAFQHGQPVRVLYDPRAPYDFRFEAERPMNELLWFALGAMLVGLFLIWRGWGSAQQQPAFAQTAA